MRGPTLRRSGRRTSARDPAAPLRSGRRVAKGLSMRAAIILAAGQGTRMKSAVPKVLHPILNRPMVQWVVDAARQTGAEAIVLVVGHGADACAPSSQGSLMSPSLQAQQPDR